MGMVMAEKILDDIAVRTFVEKAREIDGLVLFSWVYVDQQTAAGAVEAARKCASEYFSRIFGSVISHETSSKVEFSAGWYRMPLPAENNSDILKYCVNEIDVTITGVPFLHPLVVIERVDESHYSVCSLSDSPSPNLLRARIQKDVLEDKSLHSRISRLERIFQELAGASNS